MQSDPYFHHRVILMAFLTSCSFFSVPRGRGILMTFGSDGFIMELNVEDVKKVMESRTTTMKPRN